MRKEDELTELDTESVSKKQYIAEFIAIAIGVILIVGVCIGLFYTKFCKSEVAHEDTEVIEQKELVSANSPKEFYLNSFDSLMSKNSDNLVYSPYSEKLCLMLGLYGMDTESKAYSQAIKALGYEISDLDTICKDMELSQFSMSEKDDVLVSNSIWYDSNLASVENSDYISQVKEKFNADVFPSDLTSYDFVKAVNSYVCDKTNRMIPILMNEPLNPDDKLMLMNVLYMNAEWSCKFDSEDTYPDDFNGKNYSDMMHNEAYFDYAKSDKLEMCKLGYTDGLEMVLVKPVSDKTDVYDIWKKLSLDERAGLIDGTSVEYSNDTKVKLTLPKFEVKADLDLKDTLLDLGVYDMFKEGQNSFPSITEECNLHVSSILQTVKLRCDEDGTEAAAVTQMLMTTDAIMLEEPEIIEYDVDCPFIYVIRDINSGEWLFMGYTSSLN